MLVLHIRNLDTNALARKVYEEQKSRKWPGLAQETVDICQELSIENCNVTLLNKGKYVQILQEALHRMNEEKLRIVAKGKSERINTEEYGRKKYLERKIFLMFVISTELGLAYNLLQGTTKMTKDLPNQAGYADVKRQGRTSHTWFPDSVKCLEI